jgi:hypothetical protein
MHPDIHILAACTDRKRLPVPPSLRLGNIAIRDTSRRARAWSKRLRMDGVESTSAERLYAGDHWSIVRRLPPMIEKHGLSSKSWVISAGYGLVPITAKIHPYAATFADSHRDSVVNEVVSTTSRKAKVQTWWKEVCSMKTAGVKKPVSISALARKSSKAVFVIIASPSYLLALEQDLLATLKVLKDPNQLIIISSPSGNLSQKLRDHIVPSVESLQSLLGGALGSLHARVASLIFRNAHKWDLRADSLRKRLKKLASKGRSLRRYDRKRLSDREIKSFIRESLRRSPQISCSLLLQKLRRSNLACEQKRFTNLFWTVRERRHAS